MAREKSICITLTVGQLARRWGVSAERIRRLVEAGHLPDTFTIPSAGRYGAIIKIPMATVLAAESTWTHLPKSIEPKRRAPRRANNKPALDFRHFPGLRSIVANDVEHPAGALHSDERTGATS